MKISQAFGMECMKTVNGIWSSDRYADFRHFRETSELVAKELTEAGCIEVEQLELRADGKTAYGDWTVPRAWDLHDARLTLILPGNQRETIASYAETPLCVMMFSANAGKRVYKIINADSCASETDVRGKLLYTEKSPKKMLMYAVENEAAGIISDWFPSYAGIREDNDDMDDASRWENDLFYPENNTEIFGFSVSRKAGSRLRTLLEEHKELSAEAYVDANNYDSCIYTVSGLIPGYGCSEEIMLCAHLYEPGANDNATGCALLIELAKTLAKAEINGIRCGIRFVMGYEAAGMAGYVSAHPERINNTIAALNCDMVGAAKCEGAELHVWNSTLTNPSFAYDLMLDIARENGVLFRESEFELGDSLIADPSIGIPCISLVEHPSRSYHSSMDTPSCVDYSELERIGGLALEWVRIMTTPSSDDRERVKMLLDNRLAEILSDTSDSRTVLKLEAYEKAYEAFEKWGWNDKLSQIPKRLCKGPATMGGRMRTVNPDIDPFYDSFLNTMLFNANGSRTLRTIIRRTCMERGIEHTSEIEKLTLEFFTELEKSKLVSLE